MLLTSKMGMGDVSFTAELRQHGGQREKRPAFSASCAKYLVAARKRRQIKPKPEKRCARRAWEPFAEKHLRFFYKNNQLL